MKRVEILVEEQSISEVLSIILPKILSNKWILGENYFIRPHEGKSDLKKSIPKKIKTFSNFHEKVGVIIIQDQDLNDCRKLKSDLQKLCDANGNCRKLIRIVCRELESWYLGDMNAIFKAYPKLRVDIHKNKQKFKKPDDLDRPASEIIRILPEFQKISSAKAIAPHLSVNDENKSTSFIATISGIKKFFNFE